MYRHTQRSRTAPATSAVFALLFGGLAWMDPATWPLMLAAGLLLVALSWVFRQLTVEVAEGELRAWFGGGWPRYRWPLERIDTARVVHNSVWRGTGIRFGPSGMLYNVASGPGVEFRLRSGATFRLGTDDAEALAAALQTAAQITAPSRTRNEPFRTNALTH